MKRNMLLVIASVLSILFMTFHQTDDIVRGMEPGKLLDLIIVPILVVWLYGTLVLAERRSVWTLIALGVTALFSVILSARALWEHLPRRTDVQHKQGARA